MHPPSITQDYYKTTVAQTYSNGVARYNSTINTVELLSIAQLLLDCRCAGTTANCCLVLSISKYHDDRDLEVPYVWCANTTDRPHRSAANALKSGEVVTSTFHRTKAGSRNKLYHTEVGRPLL